MNQQLQIKLTLKCLQNIMMRQEQQAEKEKVKAIMKKVEKSRDKNQPKALNPVQSKMLGLLLGSFVVYKDAFYELVRLQRFKVINDAQIDIIDFLINNQTQIKLNKDTLTVDNITSKYTVILLKLKKQYDAVTKEFLHQLTTRSKQKLKKQQAKKLEAQKPEPQISKQPLSKIRSESQEQSQEVYTKNARNAQKIQRVPQKKAPVQKPQKTQPHRPQVKRQALQLKKEQQSRREVQSRRQREIQSRKQRQMESRRQKQAEARRQKQRQAQARREVQTRRENISEYNRLTKTRLLQIQKYLESKHDIKFDKAKLKEISQFIALKFEQFMKATLSKVVNIACLKNKSNTKSGNEATYFAPQYHRTCPESPFYSTPNSKVFVLLYKHKLQLYTQLRSKQFKKQDELRNALQAKTPEVQKKVDKRIQNYILKPRSSGVNPIQLFNQDLQQKVLQTKVPYKPSSKKVTVGVSHFLYHFQNHAFLKNSLLLFDAYHY